MYFIYYKTLLVEKVLNCFLGRLYKYTFAPPQNLLRASLFSPNRNDNIKKRILRIQICPKAF